MQKGIGIKVLLVRNNLVVTHNMRSSQPTCPIINKLIIENGFKISLRRDQLINRIYKVKSIFNPGSHMEKVLQRLAESKMTSTSTSSPPTQKSTTQITNNTPKGNISIVNTPPVAPSTHQDIYLPKAFKGISKALLEKVRARQAAKALEEMTRTPSVDKEATLYSRLPELAKVLWNIYVTEKKSVLPIDIVIWHLDNSFRTKLTPNEVNEHIKLLCKLLPTWASIHNVRKIDYMKLDRNVDITKVIRRLEILANEKVK